LEIIESIREGVEWVSLLIEVLAVLVIAVSIVMAVVPRGVGLVRVDGEPGRLADFTAYKQRMGRGLLLALELLLAADIVGTVALSPTLERLSALALLAVIRSFLSWSLEMEITGRWPWRGKE
jgi:uncharacterized membrane protein